MIQSSFERIGLKAGSCESREYNEAKSDTHEVPPP
jgi:hypothetical protein